MRYLLDTNIIIYAVGGKSEKLLEHFKKVPASSIVIPAIAAAEIEYGCRKSNNYYQNYRKFKQFMSLFETVDFNIVSSIAYGEIRADLEKRGQIIGPNDLLIAATALSEDCILVTHNVREFERVKGLRIEDWIQ